MPNYSGLGPGAVWGMLRDEAKNKKAALGIIDQIENEKQSFTPTPEMGEFDLMERARQLGLTSKYSELPEVQNYLNEPFSSKATQHNISMGDIDLSNAKRGQEEYGKAGAAIGDYNSQLQLLDALGQKQLTSENDIARETLSPYANDERVKEIFNTFVGNANDLNMADMGNKFRTSERESGQQFDMGEADKARAFQAGQGKLNRETQLEVAGKRGQNSLSPEEKQTHAMDVLGRIANLENHPGFKQAVGTKLLAPSFAFGLKNEPLSGTQEAGFQAEFDALKSLLTLQNIGKLKGILSDSDMKILSQAASSLNVNMPEKDFRKELTRVKGVMSKVNSGDSSDPVNQQPIEPTATKYLDEIRARRAARGPK